MEKQTMTQILAKVRSVCNLLLLLPDDLFTKSPEKSSLRPIEICQWVSFTCMKLLALEKTLYWHIN